MFIWKGYGILAIVLPFTFALLFDYLFEPTWLNGVGTGLGSLCSGLLGLSLNKVNPEALVQQKSKNDYRSTAKHRLLWIDMEYWTIFFGIISIGVILESLYGGGQMDPTAHIATISLIILFVISNYRYFKRILKNGIISELRDVTERVRSTDSVDSQPLKPSDVFENRRNAMRSETEVKDKIPLSLSDSEKKKKELFEQIRNSHITLKIIGDTDHSKYLPKSISKDDND